MARDRWALGSLAREATRNVFGRGARAIPLVVLAVLAGMASSAFIASETATLEATLADLGSRGRNVVIVASADPEVPVTIGRDSCERLTGEPGVVSAGLLLDQGRVDVVPVGTGVQVQAASTTLFPELGTAEVAVGRDLMDRVHGVFTVSAGGEPSRAVMARAHPEGLGASYSVTVPLPPTQREAEQCVVVLDRFSDAVTAGPAIMSALDMAGPTLAATPVLLETTDPIAAYRDRPGRFLPVLLGVVGAVASAIGYRLRASEIAVYRFSGTSARSVMTLLTLEQLLIAGTAVSAAALTALALHGAYLDPTVPVLWGLVLGAVWVTTALLSTLDLAVRRPHDLAKDR